jgi:hypothetical protein
MSGAQLSCHPDSMRLHLLFQTVKTAVLHPVSVKSYSKNTSIHTTVTYDSKQLFAEIL